MIIYNISSYNRPVGLVNAVRSVINQCDFINVSLNSYKHIPEELCKNNKIRILITDNQYGDAYKFSEFIHSSGYYFTIDDDIIYPPDYTDFMISNVEKYNRRSIITLHGRKYKKFPIKSFTEKAEVLHFKTKVESDKVVHIGGTGVMCIHTDLCRIPLEYFKHPNMADIWVAKWASEHKIDIVCVKHDKNYLTPQLSEGETIYGTTIKSNQIQTNIVNSLFI